MAQSKGSDSLRSKSSQSPRPNGTGSVRWLLWLAAGMLFGLVLGFGFGLARPRTRK
jgi:uncharacterized protein involved in exopolysaccharide biosynthesis